MLYLFVGAFRNNTIITAFWICTARGLSTDRACEVGAMTEGNIASADRKNSCYCNYFQRVDNKKKQHHFTMVSICNGVTLQ